MDTDLRAKLDAAQAFADKHLAECCAEIMEWRDSAVLRDGRVRELATLCVPFSSKGDSLTVAERMVSRTALRRMSEPATPADHKGLEHWRTQDPINHPDVVRQRELVLAWENANTVRGMIGQLKPVLPQLVPGLTKREAQVAATALQWLGTDDGFAMLCDALGSAGYSVTRKDDQ